MRTAAVGLVVATLTNSAPDASAADERKAAPIPHDCPVTVPSEPRYIPPPPFTAPSGKGSMFLHGSDALFTLLYSDGCWQVTGNYKSDYLSFVVWVD